MRNKIREERVRYLLSPGDAPLLCAVHELLGDVSQGK